jgi:hypothetical protein
MKKLLQVQVFVMQALLCRKVTGILSIQLAENVEFVDTRPLSEKIGDKVASATAASPSLYLPNIPL